MSGKKISWENSLIGRFESFLSRRYRLDPIVARMMAVSLVSIALANLEDYADEYGQINCGISFWWLAKSSIGKSPPIMRLRSILKAYNPIVLAPTRRVTTAGLSEWVSGKEGKTTADGKVMRKATGPHPICYFLCDELSKYVKGMNTDFGNDLMEWHSQADDKYIEGAITRTYEYERDAVVFQVFFGAGTEYVFEKIPEAFFKQGWGNKLHFLCTTSVNVERLSDSFFIGGGRDEEFETLQSFIVEEMKTLSTFEIGFCQASKLWLDFHYWVMLEAETTKGFDYSYLRKLPYAVLKLATIYSANIHNESEDGHVLCVTEDMMMQAINDGLQLYKNWMAAHEWWVQERKDKEDKEPQALTDLDKIMMWVVGVGNGYANVTEAKTVLNAANTSRVLDKMQLCCDKGWLEVFCQAEQYVAWFREGKITKELNDRFKPRSGPISTIFKITPEGRKRYGV